MEGMVGPLLEARWRRSPTSRSGRLDDSTMEANLGAKAKGALNKSGLLGHKEDGGYCM